MSEIVWEETCGGVRANLGDEDDYAFVLRPKEGEALWRWDIEICDEQSYGSASSEAEAKSDAIKAACVTLKFLVNEFQTRLWSAEAEILNLEAAQKEPEGAAK